MLPKSFLYFLRRIDSTFAKCGMCTPRDFQLGFLRKNIQWLMLSSISLLAGAMPCLVQEWAFSRLPVTVPQLTLLGPTQPLISRSLSWQTPHMFPFTSWGSLSGLQPHLTSLSSFSLSLLFKRFHKCTAPLKWCLAHGRHSVGA